MTQAANQSLPPLPLSKWMAVIGIGLVFAALPCPVGVTQKSWYILAIFISTVVGFMVQLAPVGLVSFMALALIAGLNLTSIANVLSSFASTTAWIIVCAFLIARGLQKTGLGRRIALNMVRRIGGSTLGLAYALTFSEAVIGSAMPSITARSGGIMFPISRGLCEVYGSRPGASSKRIGSFLMQLGNQVACIVSAMFMTGMASNLVIVDLARKTANLHLSWTPWFLAALVPGLLSLLAIPYVLYRLDAPEIRKTPEARELAERHLSEMGPVKRQEMIMLGVFLSALGLWATSSLHSINATAVAMIAIAVLLAANVLTWDDCLSEKACWDSFFWVSALMQMAALIADGGILQWFSGSISPSVSRFPWQVTLLAVSFLYLYVQYFFASLTAHITALYAPFLLICLAAGVPPILAALVLAMFSNLCGGLTNYSGAHSPIWFAIGYVNQGVWWKNGFICSVVNFIIFLGAGSIWWKIIRMY